MNNQNLSPRAKHKWHILGVKMNIENFLGGKNGTAYFGGYLKVNEGLKIPRKVFAWKWTHFLLIGKEQLEAAS